MPYAMPLSLLPTNPASLGQLNWLVDGEDKFVSKQGFETQQKTNRGSVGVTLA